MVIATMAESSEREELEKLIEDWNASRLDMFTISKPDANLDFSGNMRFYFQEPGARDTKVSTKVLRVSSSDTTDEVMKVLVSKFHPDMKMLTMPNYSLYEVHETGAEAHKLELDQRPLYVQLYWQREDRDGRFLLKSEDDLMTQKLFEEEGSARNPEKRNSKQRLSKRGPKNKKKNAQQNENTNNPAITLYKDKPESSFTRSKSNPEAVMKIQRKKKLEDKLKKLQDPETSGGGGGPLRIFAESLQPENPYKTILCASNDTTETVLKEALGKYEVPPEEMDQYCLTMVTIAPGNQSDPESSSGIKERVVHDKDCPAAIAASWPENNGELRFYLKKKENMPKRKQQPPKKRSHHISPSSKETSFDDTEKTETEPGSPAVHIVDVARDLPATLEFHESGEDAFFAVVVSEVNGSAVNFKLAPTFTLYMCCRYRLSSKFWPEFPVNKREDKVMMTAKKVANMMWQTVKEKNGMAGHLAFWMANSSEFLHFLKQDKDLSSLTEESQKILAHTTQQAFRSLVQCIKAELQNCLPAFLDPSEESDVDENGQNGLDERFDSIDGYKSTERSFKVKQFGPQGQPIGGDQWMGNRKKSPRPVVGDVLHTLKAAMSLLRRCRVNPALTIQLFSQVFHFVNMWLFNRIVLEPQLRLCTRSWGIRLRARLARLQDWAESQGLELAAECHLARISQAALLLQLPKQDSTVISSHCFKLNSLQIRQLLELYQPERDEPVISLELIEKAVSIAESTADELARREGQKVLLEEELELHLPFLLPDDGYSSEKIRGVPPGLKEFLDPLITPGLCRLTIQPKASGLWTVHFKIPVGLESPPLEVIKISINKGTKGMGVSIVAAKGAAQEHLGIYVKEVIDGGPAAMDGSLKPGDQILDVNGESLVGIQQEDAVKILVKAGSIVNMTVAKRAVYKHGLVELLENVAPVQQVEQPKRPAEKRIPSPLTQRKDNIPRPAPRVRPPSNDSPQRSPPLNTSGQSEVDQKAVKPEPKQGKPEAPKRRNPYDRKPYESAEQPPSLVKTVVEYKLDEPSTERKVLLVGVKAGAPLPYANPLEIQRRQKEMQQRKVQEEQEKENFERERIAREQERAKKVQEEREEAERLERMKREEQARQERERMEREQQQERQRIEKELQERQRIEREQQERQRIEREQQERRRKEREQQERQRIEREFQERQRIEREQQERQRIEREKQERETMEREQQERQRIEQERQRREREEQDRFEKERRAKEEHEKRVQQENGLDEMSRRERELEMLLEQERREKEKRLKDLERQIQEAREDAEKREQELMDRLRREREDRKEPQRTTHVRYVNDKGEKGEMVRNDDSRSSRPVRAPTPFETNRGDDHLRRPPLPNEGRNDEMRPNRPMDYNKRGSMPVNEERNTPPMARRHPLPPNDNNRGNYGHVKNPPLQDTKEDSFDMDPAEIERQFQQRLAQEGVGKSEVDGPRVIRVPVQQDNWESRGKDVDDRPRARVDWQREEEERNRKEQQWRREQDEQLVRDFQQNESFRQAPAVAEPVHPHQGDWEKDEELRRQREEDDRLREARANQLRNRIIERPEDDDNTRDSSYTNGRTRRVKFASVRTEIIQPSPDADVPKHEVIFVHDGKVEDTNDPPTPMDEEDEPLPPPPQDLLPEYYQRPPPPPKPQILIGNGGVKPPEYQGGPNPPQYRDNEHIARVKARVNDDGYATYPGPASRQQQNNNYPVPKPRGSVSTSSPDKLPFNEKMKVFNENTPPKKQMTSKWEQRWSNGDSL